MNRYDYHCANREARKAARGSRNPGCGILACLIFAGMLSLCDNSGNQNSTTKWVPEPLTAKEKSVSIIFFIIMTIFFSYRIYDFINSCTRSNASFVLDIIMVTYNVCSIIDYLRRETKIKEVNEYENNLRKEIENLRKEQIICKKQ